MSHRPKVRALGVVTLGTSETVHAVKKEAQNYIVTACGIHSRNARTTKPRPNAKPCANCARVLEARGE